MLGDKGWNLSTAKTRIKNHYNANICDHNVILYKVMVGINSITKKTRNNEVILRPEISSSYIVQQVREIFELRNECTNLIISFCHIQSGSIFRWREIMEERNGPLRCRSCITNRMQEDLENIIHSVNSYITMKNKESSYVTDHSGNRNIGDAINAGRRKKNSGRHTIKYMYGRTTDGIHFVPYWKTKIAKWFVRSIHREEFNIRNRLEN